MKILLLFLIIGFGVGTVTHSIELISGGWLPYKSSPLWKNIYWTSLTFFDPFVILLIFIRLRPALLLANIVIVSDVLINTSIFSYFGNYRIIMQLVFCIYVITATAVIHRLNTNNRYS